MFWLAGTVTVEQKDAANNALNFKKVLFKRGSYTKVNIKEKLKFQKPLPVPITALSVDSVFFNASKFKTAEMLM